MKQMTTFDYSSLTSDDAIEFRAVAERIKVRLKRTAENIIEIGKELLAVKGRLPHGEFGSWLQAEFDMTDRSARNFMRVAETFGGKTETVSDLGPKVLYALSAPSIPEEVRQTVVERAAAGEPVSLKEIANLKAEFLQQTDLRADAEKQPGILKSQRHNVTVQVPPADSDEAIHAHEKLSNETEILTSEFEESAAAGILEGIQERDLDIDDMDPKKALTCDQSEERQQGLSGLYGQELDNRAHFRVIDEAQNAMNSLSSALESIESEPDDQFLLELEALSRTLEEMVSRIKTIMEMQVEFLV